MANRKFFDEHIAFIKENVKGIGNAELTERINAHFGTNFTIQQVKGVKNNHRLTSGLDGRFNKGHSPTNKGVKMSKERYEKCKRTMFKKGQKPSIYYPVGTERLVKNKYIYVKISDKTNAKFRENWKPKHHIIYEQHYGEIPKGHAVIFADGNKENFDIDNLVCVSREELIFLNRRHLIYNDADLTKCGVLIAKIDSKAKERKKR